VEKEMNSILDTILLVVWFAVSVILALSTLEGGAGRAANPPEEWDAK
jgi:hypothetical protein